MSSDEIACITKTLNGMGLVIAIRDGVGLFEVLLEMKPSNSVKHKWLSIMKCFLDSDRHMKSWLVLKK